MDQVVVVISDCHLSAGRFYENKLNPHEDFNFDDELVDLVHHFSSGHYGNRHGKEVPVDLFIAGDFLERVVLVVTRALYGRMWKGGEALLVVASVSQYCFIDV